MTDNSFQCEGCDKMFIKGWSEEEKLKEKEENGWGDMDMSEMATVCDDCYNKIMQGIKGG